MAPLSLRIAGASFSSSLNHLNRISEVSVRLLSSSSPATPYPLYYDLIDFRPALPPRLSRRSQRESEVRSPQAAPQDSLNAGAPFEDWLRGKISDRTSELEGADKATRKYYRKRWNRMYGSDIGDERDRREDKYIELKPEVVELPTYHAREEELYFYDAFAFPWEKEKHYRMVYQLEKKYFPDQCLDKAFMDSAEGAVSVKEKKKTSCAGEGKSGETAEKHGADQEDKRLLFFEDDGKIGRDGENHSACSDSSVTEKKVLEFFKCLKKAPGVGEASNFEPFLVTRKTALPPRWDGPHGSVVLVNKPKGWTSFTICGKLRRLVKVQKVGHAGTLDPMATGLLIVCVGKATKFVDRYQNMVKSYSGIFRLGETTTTWDADSPVIQREPWEHIKDEGIRTVTARFMGETWQVPPMFSAIKIGGERMYDKARRGEMAELSARRISIYEFDIERSLNDRQNLIFKVTCSKGTYIRSLCADLGKALGSCAHLAALKREKIGEYSVEDAWSFEELEEQIARGYL